MQREGHGGKAEAADQSTGKSSTLSTHRVDER
jgi:hypothetical protein